MDQEIEQIERRMAALRMTHEEMYRRSGVTKVRWWRLKNDLLKKQDTRTRIIAQVEKALDRAEAKQRVCGVCDRKPKPGCMEFGCPNAK